MKVCLFFCGGLGLGRILNVDDVSEAQMVQIGFNRPISLAPMNTNAHYGHKDFIFVLGARADAGQIISEYNESIFELLCHWSGAGRIWSFV